MQKTLETPLEVEEETDAPTEAEETISTDASAKEEE